VNSDPENTREIVRRAELIRRAEAHGAAQV